MRRHSPLPFAKRLRTLTVAALGALLVIAAAPGIAQPGLAAAAAAPVNEDPKWTELSAAQRSALAPLEHDWATLDPDGKQKWLQVARRMPSMSPVERGRLQARMTEWVRLSPQQRGQARLGFEQAKRVGPKDRKAQWEAYQALSPEQKRQLQARASSASPSSNAASKAASGQRNGRSHAKSNIVPNPAYAAPPKPVAPTVIQAQPGATTSLMSRRPSPPMHQQTGLPKIAATPEFVDKRTLLPRRGPQAAATLSTAGSAPQARLP